LNAKELLVLGVIARKPTYGYELSNLFDIMNIRNWANISMPYIYKLLNRLLEQGFVKKNFEETASRPARDVYEITEKGLQAIEDTFTGEEFINQTVYFDFDIVLAVNSLTGRKISIKPLAEKRIKLLQSEKERLTESFNRTGGVDAKPKSAELIFEHQMSYLQMEIDWLNKVIEEFICSGNDRNYFRET